MDSGLFLWLLGALAVVTIIGLIDSALWWTKLRKIERRVEQLSQKESDDAS